MHRTDKYSQEQLIHLLSLAKWLSVRLRDKWFQVRVPLQSLITNFMIRSTEATVSKCSSKQDVIKNFAIFTRKQLCWSIFLIKQQTSRPVTLLKSNSSTGAWNIAKFLRTPILKNICKRLLLEVFYKKDVLKSLQYSQNESSQ